MTNRGSTEKKNVLPRSLASIVFALVVVSGIFYGGCTDKNEASSDKNSSTSVKEDSQKETKQMKLAESIEVFAGSASKPATEQAAKHFEKNTGIKVFLHFGGSGKMLSQLLLGKRGDIYFPGSSDYMEKAKRKGCIIAETEKRIVYLIPAINVPAENKANVKDIHDLTRNGLRIGIARPDSVCVGLYGVEVLQKAGMWDSVKNQIVTNAPSCAQTAQLVALDTVDAVMGWRVFHYWNPAKIKTILIPKEMIPRIGYIPIAISSYSTKRKEAQMFIDFLTSPEGQAIFRSWHYLPTLEEARQFATPHTPVGGEWKMTED